MTRRRMLVLLLAVVVVAAAHAVATAATTTTSLLGDPYMRYAQSRVALESWNFCNYAGPTNVSMPPTAPSTYPPIRKDAAYGYWLSAGAAPRFADCSTTSSYSPLVSPDVNALTYPASFPASFNETFTDVETYARAKGRGLGAVCALPFSSDAPQDTWSYWMLMLKNGNMNMTLNLCPDTTPTTMSTTAYRGAASHMSELVRAARLVYAQAHQSVHDEATATSTVASHSSVIHKLASSAASSFDNRDDAHGDLDDPHRLTQWGFPGPMNQPVAYHVPTHTTKVAGVPQLRGTFAGTYDLTAAGYNAVAACLNESTEPQPCAAVRSDSFAVTYFQTTYTYNLSDADASWSFRHQLRTTSVYPWLMLYQRADGISGGNGGYPWPARGMLRHPLASDTYPNWYLTVDLAIYACTAQYAQFYLPEVGGCWKNDGVSPCDGDLKTDVTRYLNFIVNPNLRDHRSCTSSNIRACPPVHYLANGTAISRDDTVNFPYQCYLLYCSPPGANISDTNSCDPYSNPNPQELMQILPCDEWSQHGFPNEGEGWIGASQVWTMNVGALAEQLWFYVDPSVPRSSMVKRWVSVEIGPEVYQANAYAEWEISQFDVQVEVGAAAGEQDLQSVLAVVE